LFQIRESAFYALVKELLEVWDAPSAACTGSATSRELAGNARFLDAKEIEKFPLSHVKAVTHFGIVIHD
jgi:hypothetical protein